jgi:hypothetical protein
MLDYTCFHFSRTSCLSCVSLAKLAVDPAFVFGMLCMTHICHYNVFREITRAPALRSLIY